MTVELERDARLFLDAVYGTKPEGSVIVVGPYAKPHFVYSPESALPWVVGKVNVFSRVTLLAKHPGKGRRGNEADSIAIPGLWADLDVNGSPNGKGGIVTGAFDSPEQAVEFAHAFLTPTLVVSSGYGIQPWWLFEDVMTIDSDAMRDRLKQHATAWLHALRERAGVAKFDSVADLARVMRPPGSLNGKGDQPVPVRLLDSSGPRYTLEALAEIAPANGNGRPPRSTVAPAGAVDVARFLDDHPKLVRFVRHTGKRPSDGSASAWDFALGCAAAERGASNEQLAALIRHARQQHDDPKFKGERDDYLARTIEAIRQRVPAFTEGGRDAILTQLTDLVGVAEIGLHVAHVIVSGYGSRAMATLVLSDGSAIEFARLDDAASPTTLARRIAADVGVTVEFDANRAQKVAALMRRYAGRQAHEQRHADAVSWGIEFLRLAEVREFSWADTDARWAVWSEIATRDPDRAQGMLDDGESSSADAYARRALVARDLDSGRRYVRAGWMQEFVGRHRADASPGDVIQLLERAGWLRPSNAKGRIEVYAPHYRDRGPGARLGHSMFVVPPGWEDAQAGSEEPC